MPRRPPHTPGPAAVPDAVAPVPRGPAHEPRPASARLLELEVRGGLGVVGDGWRLHDRGLIWYTLAAQRALCSSSTDLYNHGIELSTGRSRRSSS